MKIPEHIKEIAAKKNISATEHETLKKFIIKEAVNYLDLKNGGNSSINITDIIKYEIKFLGTNYNFERDIGRRMERTRDYTMYEENKSITVVPLDRPLLEKYSHVVSILMLILGSTLTFIGTRLNNQSKKQSLIQSGQQLNIRVVHQSDSSKTYQIELMDSSKHHCR